MVEKWTETSSVQFAQINSGGSLDVLELRLFSSVPEGQKRSELTLIADLFQVELPLVPQKCRRNPTQRHLPRAEQSEAETSVVAGSEGQVLGVGVCDAATRKIVENIEGIDGF